MAWNPYLEEWAAAKGSRVHGWICCSELGSSLSEYRMLACWRDDEDNRRQIRDYLSRKYAFGVPGNSALDCLAQYGPLVEIGAGTGYWARCLRERGVDIVAYDVMGDSWRSWFRPSILAETRHGGTRAVVARPHPQRVEPVLWTEVLEGGPEVLRCHPARTLLLCWPDPWSGFDEASLLAYPGERVAVVGESSQKGPGSDGFQARLHRSWRRIEEAPVPRWHSSQDRLIVYGRR
ncbi:MAG: class I SAM-dependent methyltransferase [Candidatus Dormibacteraeota bacterium]|nr:class I SAM-dependent methyltransferase [Candidatus Dormibacteraeota bacterium]